MPSEPEDLVLGNYRVLRHDDRSYWILGRGGFGTTYKAEHQHLKQIYALKVINDHLVRNDEAKQRFLREAQMAAQLDHPNIARIYDFGECGGIFYYAMSYCSGGDLEQYSAKHGAQPWSLVKDFALQIVGALETAHGQGLLHRDLKPSNIMLAEEDGPVNLRLIDFGLVKALENYAQRGGNQSRSPSGIPDPLSISQTIEGSFMGNPLTASPEQFREEETLDERSDLFSLGVTLWCLLHGGSPFGTASPAEIAHLRLSRDGHLGQLPADLDESAKYVLGRLLATNKEDRFRNAAEVREAIVNDMVGDGEAAPAPAAPSDPGEGSEESWDELWDIGARLRQFSYGSYYSCTGKLPGMNHATIFIPEHDSVAITSIQAEARKLLNSQVHALSGFSQEGQLGGLDCFLCLPFPSGDFRVLLQAVSSLGLQNNLPFFQQIASAIDEVIAQDVPGAELDDHQIMLGVSTDYQQPLFSREDWIAYFENDGASAGGHTAGLRAVVLPKLIKSDALQEAGATILGQDMAASPIARFGGFLYRTLSGRPVNQGAYMSSAAYVSNPRISEQSNRYLSAVMSGEKIPESCMELLNELCQQDGVSWGTKQLKDDLAMTISTYPSHADAPPAPIQTSPSLSAPLPQPPAAQTSRIDPLPPLPATTATTATTSISIPGASPVTAPPPPTSPAPPAQSDVKRKKLLAAIAAAVIALFIVGLMIMNRGGGSVDEPAQELGDGSLRFSDLTVSGTQPAEGLQLQDREGVSLGEFQLEGSGALVSDFPLEVFEDSARWPLKIALRGDVKDHIILQDAKVIQDKFIDGGDDSKSYGESLALEIRPYREFEPAVTLDGAVLDVPGSVIADYLTPDQSGLDWRLTSDGKKIGIALPAGGEFPVRAKLSLPLTSAISVSLGAGGESRWGVKLPRRRLRVVGLTEFVNLKFEPEFSTLRNQTYAGVLLRSLGETRISRGDFNLAGKEWELPAVKGKLVVELGGSSWTRLELESDTIIKLILPGSDGQLSDGEFGEPAKIESLRLTAEEGDAEAQADLAFEYNDLPVKQESALRRRFEWLKIAAEEPGGVPRAKVEIATAYLQGTGVRKDEKEAVRLFELIVESGDKTGRAHNNLAYCYERALGGLPKDLSKAKEHYKVAYEHGHVEAMVSLGIILTNSSVADEIASGIALFERAKELGSVAAIRELGYCHVNGLGKFEVDKVKGRELLKEAVKKGDSSAKKMLEELGAP